MSDRSDLTWRKSSFSSAGGECVEIATLSDGRVGIRDSKNPDSGVLRLSASAVAAWLATVKSSAVSPGSE